MAGSGLTGFLAATGAGSWVHQWDVTGCIHLNDHEGTDGFVGYCAPDSVNDALYNLVVNTPAQALLKAIQAHPEGRRVAESLECYLGQYGHQIYSLDYVEPTPCQDPAPVLSTLKTQVQDRTYDPIVQQAEVDRRRQKALHEISRYFKGRLRWQFKWRLFWAQRFYANRMRHCSTLARRGLCCSVWLRNWALVWYRLVP